MTENDRGGNRTAMNPNIIIIGHIINETIQSPDRTVAPVLGSPAAYSSVIASVLSAQVGLVTKIGTRDLPFRQSWLA
ncbi:MAG: hypothetical protein ACE5LU_13445 [Anaerolineae bacterium]